MKVYHQLINQIALISDTIRYVAIYEDNQLSCWQKDGLENASSSNSDKYEELIVNPTLLKIVSQRGNIDCGGLDYVVVKYGNFFQLIIGFGDGHLSVCIDNSTNPVEIECRIRKILNKKS